MDVEDKVEEMKWYTCAIFALMSVGCCQRHSKQTIHVDPITIEPIYIRQDITVHADDAGSLKPATAPAK